MPDRGRDGNRDEDVDDSHRVVLTDIVIKAFGQQRHLLSVFALDESLHGHLALTGWQILF